MAVNPALIMGGAQLLSSALGAFQGNANVKQQIAAQREENEKTRAYNLMLARMQNAWNLEQWNRENAYNDPAAQRERLKNAGMNVDIAYSGMPGDNLSASSPAMTSGAPATSADMSALGLRQTVGSVTTQALQNSLLAAQIDKTKAETEGQSETNRILTTDADIAEFTKGNSIELAGLAVKSARANLKLTKQQLKNLGKEFDVLGKNIEVMTATIDSINAATANTDEDTVIKKLSQPYIQKQLDATVKSILASARFSESSASLNYQTVRQMVALLPYMIQQADKNVIKTDKDIAFTVAQTVLVGKQTVEQLEKNIQAILTTQGIKLTNEGLVLDNATKRTANDYQELLLQIQVINQSLDGMNKLLDGLGKIPGVATGYME